jgi:hypothetical protein
VKYVRDGSKIELCAMHNIPNAGRARRFPRPGPACFAFGILASSTPILLSAATHTSPARAKEAANERGQAGGLKSRFHVATPDWQGVTS